MNVSSTSAFSAPVCRHCAMNFCFERPAMRRITKIDSGTVTTATSASSGEITNIITSTPTMVSADGEQLAERLLQALGDVVDVVGDTAEQVAARLPVDVAAAAVGAACPRRRTRSRNIVRCTTPASTNACRYDSTYDSQVQAEREQQHAVQLAEVDAGRARCDWVRPSKMMSVA